MVNERQYIYRIHSSSISYKDVAPSKRKYSFESARRLWLSFSDPSIIENAFRESRHLSESIFDDLLWDIICSVLEKDKSLVDVDNDPAARYIVDNYQANGASTKEKVFVFLLKHRLWLLMEIIAKLYYGKRLRIEQAADAASLAERQSFPPGNSNVYDAKYPKLSLESLRLEMSSYGKGDVREPFVEITHADGSYTSDFLFSHARIVEGKAALETLPSAYEEEGQVQTLILTLRDDQYDLTLELYYSVFYDRDVIVRSAKLINTGATPVELNRLMSTQLDLEDGGYVFTTFRGNWAREMYRHDTPANGGKLVNASYAGTSSNRANPFVMIDFHFLL
jgi:hypothetical protein